MTFDEWFEHEYTKIEETIDGGALPPSKLKKHFEQCWQMAYNEGREVEFQDKWVGK